MIRPVSIDDCRDIFDWRNDKLSQTMFMQFGDINYDDHCSWFEEALISSSKKIYIGTIGQVKIGMCRFDFTNNNVAYISINIAPDQRSKGHAKILLKKSITLIKEERPRLKCIAEIKSINTASQKVFQACDFKLIDRTDELFRYVLV